MGKPTSGSKKDSVRKPQKKKATKPPPRMLSVAQVAKAVQTMAAPKGAERFTAGKALCVTAEKDPSRVYPYVDSITPLLDSKSKVVCWNAIQLLSFLAMVDEERKIDATVDRLLAFIRGKDLISAANAIKALGLIGRFHEDLVDRIVPGMLAVEKANYRTPECRNVAIGQTLEAFEAMGPTLLERNDVARFIRRQKKNPRETVARRAQEMSAFSTT